MRAIRSKDIAEELRNDMVADSLVLTFRPDTNLAAKTVLESICEAMAATGDPLERIWIETCEGKKGTYSWEDVEDLHELLMGKKPLNYMSAFPKSERGNSRSRWLAIATAFNNSPNARTLFFGVPSISACDKFGPHLVLLRALVARELIPEYGFGFHREYGFGPDYFAIGHVYNTTTREMDATDWNRIGSWASERAGSPDLHPRRFRHARGLILDVFPLNVLTDVHLTQLVKGSTLREWIHETTGPASLVRFADNCFVWSVPQSQITRIAKTLDEAQLIIASPPKTKH